MCGGGNVTNLKQDVTVVRCKLYDGGLFRSSCEYTGRYDDICGIVPFAFDVSFDVIVLCAFDVFVSCVFDVIVLIHFNRTAVATSVCWTL